jgi:F-type H+-transporting ATPase subunit a
MIPLVTHVEFISHLTRSLSLAVRLFANMFGGHVLLAIISFVVGALLYTVPNFTIGILILPMLIFIFTLEQFTCALQAYVFTALVNIYQGEIVHCHNH